MSEFIQRTEGEIQLRQLLPRGEKILVAVSGGVDSMVLLQILHTLALKHRWQISVAHFNHQLRGRASHADQKLVAATAQKMSLPFFSERGEVSKLAQVEKISVEMAARKLRHEFLARVAREQNIATIALAHHADDQVELFFLRLLRGAGGEGLAGMKWHSPSPFDKRITLVRPLLACPKTELAAFARESNVRFRKDASNDSADFLRNRIRNELLPLLQKNYQPGLKKTVLRLMEITGAEAEFVSEMAQRIASSLGLDSNRPPAKLRVFSDLPVAIQRKVLQKQLTDHGLASDFELIKQLCQTSGKFVSVSPVMSVARNEVGKLICRESVAAQFNVREEKVTLSGRAGQGIFGGRQFQWRIQVQKTVSTPKIWLAGGLSVAPEFFDANKVGDEIVLRHWRAGDRFQPIGMKAAVKLQDLFVNAKIPAARRHELVLATTAAGEIFWVEGLRIGDGFKLGPSTRRQLLWFALNTFKI